MRVLVCGSRGWTDAAAVQDRLSDLYDRHGADLIVIEGGASGVDGMARSWAQALGAHVATVDALWSHYGKSAGPRRNRAMLLLKPDLCLAFHRGNSRGTADMIAAARRHHVPTEVVAA
jgi:hypothetical protein